LVDGWEAVVMDISTERVDEILQRHDFDESSLIAVLQEIQAEAGYLPMHALARLTERLEGVSPARVRALSTFYRSFSLVPTGRHRLAVCMGTACHIRGGRQVLEKLERELGIAAGGTTPDRSFSLETVRCLGCCSLAPVLRVGEQVHGRLDQQKAARVLRRYR
jgi:NADH-quinone oxidoreductase subunit E